jgi:hypothetical protein
VIGRTVGFPDLIGVGSQRVAEVFCRWWSSRTAGGLVLRARCLSQW